MAEIFGEIIEPESRAFWDDDELDVSHFQYNLRWTDDNTMPSTMKNFLIVEGNVVSEFTRLSTISNTKEICIIEHGNFKPSLIYKISNNLYICLVSPNLDAKHATEFTMTIAEFLLRADTITALTCQHVSSYKSDTIPNSSSFLRSLATVTGKSLLQDVERIKQPNIVCGVVAAVVSYAEILELSATMYVLYVEDLFLDSEVAIPLKKLFSNIPDGLRYEPVFTQNSFSSNGNLYM